MVTRRPSPNIASLIPSKTKESWTVAELSQQQCVPCRGDTPPLSTDEIEALLPQVPDWELTQEAGEPRLRRSFRFASFMDAMAFAQRVAELAEAQGHHPRLTIQWRRVTVEWWTHAIRALHQNDFIMAARTDSLYAQWQAPAQREADVVEQASQESFPASDAPGWVGGRA